MDIVIRETHENDFDDIIQVEKSSFGEDSAANLTAELLSDPSGEPKISLLAFDDDRTVGHILFTKCYIKDIESCPLMHILAPLAVIPEYQNKGIGRLLINHGIEILKAMNSQLLFVLGHIEYYPKYGFINNATKLGYEAPYPIPSEVADAWMVQSLNDGEFNLCHGKVICADSMNKPEHWRE